MNFIFLILLNATLFWIPAKGQSPTSDTSMETAPAAQPAPEPPASPTSTPAVAAPASQPTPTAPPSSTTAASPPPSTREIRGRVLEKGTKRPLSGVNVFILPAKLKATTQPDGSFVFSNVPDGSFSWVVNFSGYIRLEQGDSATGETKTLYLERLNYNSLETTIVGKASKRDDTTKSMRAEEFLTIPGAQGDPVKAVQNMPGAARVNPFSSQVVIQGSAPKDTTYLLDDHPVPLVFHFGGLTSVVMPEAIESVDYLSAGFGAEYGRALGGLVGLNMKDPVTDRHRGFVNIDLMKSGLLLEGPINDKSSYLVTGRYSYISFLLGAVAEGNESFDLTVAPSFADLGGVYKRKLSDTADFKFTALGSRDKVEFLIKKPVNANAAFRGSFNNETLFYRFIPQFSLRHPDRMTSRYSLSLGQQSSRVDIGDNFITQDEASLSVRADLEKALSESWTSILGLDARFTDRSVGLRLPTSFTGNSGSGLIETEITQSDFMPGAYWRNELKSGRWTHIPSLRVDHFTQTKETHLQPRLAERFEIDPSLFLRAAGGLYYQPPEPQELASSVGNPDLQSPRAWHATFGAEKDFRGGTDQGYQLSSGVFYRKFERLVIGATTPGVRYTNDGTGDAYGLEAQLKYNARPWSAWLVYTLSRSVRTEPDEPEHLFRYDQTHNLNLMASVDLSNNWKLSSRLRFVTGNPTTPVISGIYDAEDDTYIPIRGPVFSERVSPFFQADIRVDKKWIYPTWILSAYLDIQNLTNRENAETVRYSYDYRQSTPVTGLPILPILGVGGEF